MNIQEIVKWSEKDIRRKNPPETLEIPEWVKGSLTSIRRDALPDCHPQSYYNYIKNELGLEPEDYGIFFTARNHHGDKIAKKVGVLMKTESQDTINFFQNEYLPGFSNAIDIDSNYFLKLNEDNEIEIWKKIKND